MSDRILIFGGPRCGKTRLARAMLIDHTTSTTNGCQLRHTDDLIETHDWSAGSAEAAAWIDETPAPWIIEGVSIARALRKWFASHPGTEKPCDKLILLLEPLEPLSKGQETMLKGCKTVWAEVRPELVR